MQCHAVMLFQILLLMITAQRLESACPTNIDVCLPENYVELDELDRSANYSLSGTAPSDYSLDLNWYRSISGAGGDMPTEVVYTGQCNAIAPIYLTGDLPSFEDGITEVSACASFLSDNCSREYSIPIRNCVDFNVYCLGPTIDAHDRYCMGTATTCPEGTVSDTGFTPCEPEQDMDLTLVNDPVITVEVEYDEDPPWRGRIYCRPYYVFECDIEHHDANVLYDVQWYANGNLILESVGADGLSAGDMPSQITSSLLLDSDYNIGTTLTCRVTPKSRNDHQANYGALRETEFFAGINVSDSSQFIVLREGGPPAYYNASFTIPFRCSFLSFTGDCSNPSCDANRGISVARVVGNEEGECANSNDVTVKINPSDRTGCIADTEEWGFSLEVNANPDHAYSSHRHIALQLRTTTGDYNDFWADYELPRAAIQIDDGEFDLRNRHCVISDDPHQQSFDGSRWTDIQMTGSFLMYKHRTLPISVEVFFVATTAGYYTRNCGGAVRSGGEVFVFDACNDRQPWRVSAYECGEGLRNMKVSRVSSYYAQYQVILPTGTRVILGTGRQYVYPSVFDWEQTEGLCGYLNGVDSDDDDKVLRGTNIVDTPTPSPRWGTRFMEYNAFSNSYRVPENESLYFGVVTDDLEYDNISFCVCSGDNNNPGADCASVPNVDCIAGSHAEASGDFHRCTYARRRRRDINGENELDETPNEFFSYDPTFVAQPAGWINGWTNETSYEHCENVFSASSSIQACSSVPDLDVTESVHSCVADIYITGESEYSQLHVDTTINVCQSEVARYDYESENSTDLPVSPDLAREILESVCDNDCSGHGTCEQGLCVCDEGFTDIDCGSDLNHVPVLYDLPRSGLCDLSVRPCELINVYADAYVMDSVFCKLQLRNQSGVTIGQDLIVPAEYIHDQRVVCPISLEDFGESPRDVFGFYTIDISTSNNEADFSDSKRLTVYNGACYDCPEGQCLPLSNVCQYTDVCYNHTEGPVDIPCLMCNGNTQAMEVQERHCYIQDQCYTDGDRNPDDTSEYCHADVDGHNWSIESSETSTVHSATESITTRLSETPESHRDTTLIQSSETPPLPSVEPSLGPSSESQQDSTLIQSSQTPPMPSVEPSIAPSSESQQDSTLIQSSETPPLPSLGPSSEAPHDSTLIQSSQTPPLPSLGPSSEAPHDSTLIQSPETPPSVDPSLVPIPQATDESSTRDSTTENANAGSFDSQRKNKNKKNDNDDNILPIVIVLPLLVIGAVIIVVVAYVVCKSPKKRTEEEQQITYAAEDRSNSFYGRPASRESLPSRLSMRPEPLQTTLYPAETDGAHIQNPTSAAASNGANGSSIAPASTQLTSDDFDQMKRAKTSVRGRSMAPSPYVSHAAPKAPKPPRPSSANSRPASATSTRSNNSVFSGNSSRYGTAIKSRYTSQ